MIFQNGVYNAYDLEAAKKLDAFMPYVRAG